MKELERSYNIPIRKEFLKVPKHKRAKKAIAAIKSFLVRHTKTDDIKLGENLNEKVWENGIRNPPHHVKVNVHTKNGVAYAELEGFVFDKKEDEKPKKKATTLKEKVAEKVAGKRHSKPVKKEAKEESSKVKEDTAPVKAKTVKTEPIKENN